MFHYLSVDEGERPIAQIKSANYTDVDMTMKERKEARETECLYINSSSVNDESKPKEYKITGKKELFPLMTRADKEGHAQRIFLAGGTLSGKSYLAARFARDYNILFPKNKVILFSWVNNDKNFSDIKNFHKMRVDESILDDPIDLSELHDSLCIFDDIEHFTDKYIVQELERIRSAAINAGRHDNIDVICVRQNLLDGHKTKTILNSSFQIIGFPHGGGRYQFGEWLKRHMYLSKPVIDRILNLPSRWVLINKNPNYCLYSKGCFML